MSVSDTQLHESLDTWGSYVKSATGENRIEKYHASITHCMAEAFRTLKATQPEHFFWDRGLDVTCGGGKSTRLMARFCRQLTGIDRSSELIRQATQQNESDFTEFELASFEDYATEDESLDVIGATWFLNHVHTVEKLRQTIEKMHRILKPSGAIALVIPSDSFTSQQTQILTREHFGWQQAWSESTAEYTRGVFSSGNQWTEATIWQPMFLARLLNEYFDIHCLDVKRTLIQQSLLDEMQSEPLFEVLYGVKRSGEVQVDCKTEAFSGANIGSSSSREATSKKANATSLPNNQQRSYSAGSTSSDADAFRVVKHDLPARLGLLTDRFPGIRSYLDNPMIISAYPASLGLDGLGPMVDTFLHPPAFLRALRAAAVENRSAIITSQPLAGAELLLHGLDAADTLPRKILWAVGGYYLPKSLENTIRHAFESRDVTVEVLHCYGAAELAHTCLAAGKRDDAGWPEFQPVLPGLQVSTDAGSGELVLGLPDRSERTGDQARQSGESWQIISNVRRLDPAVREELESWSMYDWTRRTGHLHAENDTTIFQLRSGIQPTSSNQLSLNDFWQRFGGGWTTKPNWSRHQHSW
jgi:2-polyprenyl-3-methyl-5-hydroxy-6-metoxy-1,4-benzoquinol methylase